jgi:N-acetylneuraminate synthase
MLVHATSNYTGKTEEMNLRMVQTLKKEFDCIVGYSGHEDGLSATIAAVALGACYVERHITLDHNMWGSDHKVSLDPNDFKTLVREIRLIESALGDGVKRVYDSEKLSLAKLRNCK